MANRNRVLLKLRPTAGLAAADRRTNLRPLYEPALPASELGLAQPAQWYVADLADAPTAWDAAHTQIAAQLGIDESAVLFAEPDLEHRIFADPDEKAEGFAIGSNCQNTPQSSNGGRATHEGFAWHLGKDFSGLGPARDSVQFADPRTRIGHIDTGYDKNHIAKPEHIAEALERNFVDGDDDPNSSQDPNSRGVLDNSGHGTGTIGVLAGRRVQALDNIAIGGAPQAEILPLRIANRVVLFKTSAFAQALQYAIRNGCDVISISMGGLPSHAWNEAVNAAYEAGVCIVAAAGNNVAGAPTKHVVYPARYHRTIAVCGVMANGQPYDGLSATTLEGNFGPDSCMTAAIASYTPNIPWPVFGCGASVRLNGEGTSAATPQVAAAVALWYEKYKTVLPRDWRRVEAVRKALFDSATKVSPSHFGNGILKAHQALERSPVLTLSKTPEDRDSFSFLRVITGFGISEPTPREDMFNLELTQLWLVNRDLQSIIPDPDGKPAGAPDPEMRRFMEAVIADPRASQALRKHIAARYPVLFGSSVKGAPPEIVAPPRAACDPDIAVPDPPFRRLRTYAIDPSLSLTLDTASINEATLKVKWEKLDVKQNQFEGEYLRIVDTDDNGPTYAPVDLNDSRLLAQDGHPPAEGNPAFHQQMVYAVAMSTIALFERAMGRVVLWRHERNPQNDNDDSRFRRQLLVRPHAFRQANAFYSPDEIALKFGYFQTSSLDRGDMVPDSTVYACLSHDIIAHETTHAILDGIHSRFNEPSNPDALAMHEAFADIVALLQHFTIPQILENEIGKTRGNLEAETILGSLALQFGSAMGGRGALRDAIGTFDKNGVWTRLKPDPAAYRQVLTPHARGAILVAAIFDAFLAIYNRRTADLLRIYTGGTGVLQAGAIHPDLVRRLAEEASKSAQHVLNMCIRAIDYVPPVDLTFGEYLRAVITADFDLVSDDAYNYRLAFVEAFRKRGIYPPDVEALSVDTLRWKGVDVAELSAKYPAIVDPLNRVFELLKDYANSCFYLNDREKLFTETRRKRGAIHNALEDVFGRIPKDAAVLASMFGLDAALSIEVHELRSSLHVKPDGRHVLLAIVAVTQSKAIDPALPGRQFRGGCTMVIDLSEPTIRYVIRKNIASEDRRKRTVDFLARAAQDPLRALLVAPADKEPFRALHLLSDIVE
jgi:subtilisin family serine protease